MAQEELEYVGVKLLDPGVIMITAYEMHRPGLAKKWLSLTIVEPPGWQMAPLVVASGNSSPRSEQVLVPVSKVEHLRVQECSPGTKRKHVR